MSDCPGVCPLNGNPDYPLHCPDCADNEYSWLPREYSEKVRENAQLRAHLAQRTAALRALLDWAEDEEPCTALDTVLEQARAALADLPDAPKEQL